MNYLTEIPSVTIPDLTQKTSEEAEQIFEKLDLGYNISGEFFHPTIEKGLIISTKPRAGREVKANRLVKVFISKGEAQLLVPDLVGRTVEESKKLLGESLLSGKGAGGSPTGSAVVSDIIDITFDKQLNRPSKRNLEDKFQDVSLCPISETSTQFFFRVSAPDETGILEKITGVLGRHDVSISKVLQKEIQNNAAEIVFVTHSVLEKKMTAALDELKTNNIVNELLSLIRVGLDE